MVGSTAGLGHTGYTMTHRPPKTIPAVSPKAPSVRGARQLGATPSPNAKDSSGCPGSGSWLSQGRVLIHTAGLTAVAPTARATTRGQLAIALDFSSRWAVPVFVMVSGALLLDPSRYRGAGDFLRRRALRLVPAIVVWHLVYPAYLVAFTNAHITAAYAIQLTLQGRLWTALYFFWIVLGLAIITPVLVPWIAASSRRAVSAGRRARGVPPSPQLVTAPIRRTDLVWVETPWTWWIPYLGYYLLGYALRDTVLTRWRLALTSAAVAVGGSALLTWQWRQSEGVVAARALRTRRVLHYRRSSSCDRRVGLSTCTASSVEDGLLRALFRPSAARVARRLGDATLGVFGVHLLVIEGLLRLPLIGGNQAANSVSPGSLHAVVWSSSSPTRCP